MSELAFNLNGEPFELPGAAVGWRVRKMKPKGAPEVVYSRDGVPLILPIDADIDDLRRAARSEGRFRLDPVDEHNRMIANASAGYVCVPASESSPEPAQPINRPQTDNVAIEAMRLNTELARSIVDKFPMVMESAAALLRAADSAGITTRPPRILADDQVDEDDLDDEAEPEDPSDEAATKSSGLVGMVETLAPFVMPAIVNAIAGGKLKLPGGIGALLDCRRARPKARSHAEAPAPHATSTPGAAPAPGPRDPAPAGAGYARSQRVTSSASGSGGRGFARPRPAEPRHGAPAATSAGSSTATASASRSGAQASGSPAASSTAPARPGSSEGPASTAAARPLVPDPPAAAEIEPLDAQLAVTFQGPVSTLADGRSAAAGEPPSHAVHRNDMNASIDTTTPHDLPHTEAADHELELESEAEAIDTMDDDQSALESPGEASTESEDELPTLDAATLAHFAAIQRALTLREGMLARALAAELSPGELRTWMTELGELSVADAVARIRSVIDDAGTDDAAGGGS